MARRRARPFRRFLARLLGTEVGSSSVYAGAAFDRTTADWVRTPIASADEELRYNLMRLRARSRELCRNNAYARRFLRVLSDNVVGPAGVALQAQVKRSDGELDERLNSHIEERWKSWGALGNCTVDGRDTWVDVQRLCIECIGRDGEALFRRVGAFEDSPFGYALQQLDPDQLDQDFSIPARAGQNEVRQGVEVNQWGRPVAYHIWNRHPNEIHANDRRRERIPADQILHLYVRLRPGQTRGEPWLAPVLLPLHLLRGYDEAEVMAARGAAASMGFFVQDPEAEPDPDSPAAELRKEGSLSVDVEPNTFQLLPVGVSDVKTYAPGHPNAQYAVFHKAMLRMIAAGVDVSYHSLSNDLESVNYSSIRAGLLPERDHHRVLQQWFGAHFLSPVYLDWILWANTVDALPLPSRDVARYSAHRWGFRGWEWVDPLKDIAAIAGALQLMLETRSRVAAERGLDFHEILADRRREADAAASMGFVLSDVIGNSAAAAPAGSGGGPAADEEEEEDAAAARLLLSVLEARGRRSGNGVHANT